MMLVIFAILTMSQITGATSGIGEACAWRFAEEKARLVLIGRRRERLETLKEQLETEIPNSQVHIEAMSVADLEAVQTLQSRLPEQFKDVDVLINNAGLALGVTGVDQNDMAQLETQLNTNVLGLAAMCRAFSPTMISRGRGHIVNMGSIAGYVSQLL
jgi:3-hydroxy acid dehydrogenase / malonic semialdehyde reductase